MKKGEIPMTKRATLRDIAAACGVSSALVSVVLNGKEGRIRCTESCRKKIRETAEKIGYVPNRLARSMSLGRLPVAAIVMHMEDTELCSGSYAYFNELFPVLTLALNARDIEVLFVPCRDSAEQLSRLDRIIGGGLAGAVISNIVPDDYDRVARRLMTSGLPYMLLGYPLGYDCHGVCALSRYPLLDEVLRSHPRYKNCYVLTHIHERRVLCRYPFARNYIWLAEKCDPVPEILGDPGTLIVCAGLAEYLRFRDGIENPLIIEREGVPLPEGVPSSVIGPGTRRKRIAEIAAETVADWFLSGQEPASRQIFVEP